MIGAIIGDYGRGFTRYVAKAKESAECTHSHPEGIKGAQATALAIFMARMGASKDEIKTTIESEFGYDLNFTIDELRPE